MKIADVIRPDRVIVGLRAADKAQLLQELAGRAASALSLDRRMIFDALLARENLGSTGLGKGFALPHARLEALGETFALFVRLGRPIDFASIDERPVDLVILLLTPANGANHHLATLAALSRPLRDGLARVARERVTALAPSGRRMREPEWNNERSSLRFVPMR